MNDLPLRVDIHEEGPREGFQIEPGPITTERKIALIDALSETGLRRIQIASYVNPKWVPGWADAEAVVDGYHPQNGVRYTALWLNEKGLKRAIAQSGRLALRGTIALFTAHGIPVEGISIMAVFGCNFAGEISLERVIDTVQHGHDIAAANAITVR